MSQGKHVLPDLILIQKKDLQRLTELNEKQNYNVLNNGRSNIGDYSLKYRRPLGGESGFNIIKAHAFTFLMLPFRNAPIHLAQVDLMNVNEAPRYADGIELSKRLVFTASQGEENLWEIKLPYLENLKMPQRIGGAGQGLF